MWPLASFKNVPSNGLEVFKKKIGIRSNCTRYQLKKMIRYLPWEYIVSKILEDQVLGRWIHVFFTLTWAYKNLFWVSNLFSLIHTLNLPISILPGYSPLFVTGVFSTLWQNGRGRDFWMFLFWVTNINFFKYFKIWMLSLITGTLPIFSKGEVSVKNVHYPSLYQVYLLLKRDAYKIGKRTVCLFIFL